MRRELGEMYAAWVKEWIAKLDEENMVTHQTISQRYSVADLSL